MGAILDSTYTNTLKHEQSSNSISLVKIPRRYISKPKSPIKSTAETSLISSRTYLPPVTEAASADELKVKNSFAKHSNSTQIRKWAINIVKERRNQRIHATPSPVRSIDSETLKSIKAINSRSDNSSVIQNYRPEKETIVIGRSEDKKSRLSSLKQKSKGLKLSPVKVNDFTY